MGAYRPSCVVNLRLVFDETLHVRSLGTPQSTADAPGTVLLIPLLLPSNRVASFVSARIPMKASIELPGYRQAGQFSFELPFRDLPIDPRTVRAAAVDIHLGAISDDAFAEGMVGQPVGGWRPSILRTQDEAGEPNPETLLMTGTVDQWGVKHNDASSIVSISGRDMRGLLLDTPLTNDPKLASSIMEGLDLSLPIDRCVASLLAVNPLFSDFTVVVNPAEWGGVLPSVGGTSTVPRHRQGARGTRTGGRATPPSAGGTITFWDMIVRLCYLVAAVPFFVGKQLHIRPQRSINDQINQGGPMDPTPFAGGVPRSRDVEADAPISPPLRFRRLAYGRDVAELSFDRKMAGLAKPQTVVARSVDSGANGRGALRNIEGRWPPKENTAARRQTVAADKPDTQENIVVINIPNVASEERLTEIAHGAYEEIARREIGGQCSTKNLASFGGDNSDPDLLRLKPGDGIEFLVDTTNMTIQTPLISALTDHLRNSFEEQVALIAERLGDENLARVIVATSRGVIQEIPTYFRVQNVKYAWSCDSGVGIDFDFQNYVIPLFGAPVEPRATGEAVATRVSPRRRHRVNVVNVYEGGTTQVLPELSIIGSRTSDTTNAHTGGTSSPLSPSQWSQQNSPDPTDEAIRSFWNRRPR